MCHKVKTIAKNCNGQLSFCESCKVYHLTFNNFYIELTELEMNAFKNVVTSVEVAYWETKYENVDIKRKIPLNTMQQNLSLVFNRQELESLKDLILLSTTKPYCKLSVNDIDYLCFFN